jgi:membrane protein DedA with SNARE-associated domain
MLEIAPFLEHFPYLGIFALLILGGIGLPFPEDATLLLSGFLISHGVTKPFPTFIVVYFGLIIDRFFPLFDWQKIW